MAKGRGRRDGLHIANGTLPGLGDLGLSDLSKIGSRETLQVEDRRYDPGEVSPIPRSRSGFRTRIVPSIVAKTISGKRAIARGQFNQMAFETPREVAVCVRRQQRKEVLHAKGKAGGKVRRGKSGPWSHIHCRRR